MTAPSLTPLEALTVEAFGLTLDEELDFEVECEIRAHNAEPEFHHGYATHAMSSPCGQRLLCCQGFVDAVIATGGTLCLGCRIIHAAADVHFTPLPTGGTK